PLVAFHDLDGEQLHGNGRPEEHQQRIHQGDARAAFVELVHCCGRRFSRSFLSTVIRMGGSLLSRRPMSPMSLATWLCRSERSNRLRTVMYSERISFSSLLVRSRSRTVRSVQYP